MFNESIKVSCIVPIYNVENYLPHCIESILNQTHSNLELILVDDGSPDNCGKICDEYSKKDERILVIHKQNGGVSSARNAGLNIATGEYICFSDSDDWLEKNYIEYLLEIAIKNDAMENNFKALDRIRENLLFNSVLIKRSMKFAYWFNYWNCFKRLYEKELENEYVEMKNMCVKWLRRNFYIPFLVASRKKMKVIAIACAIFPNLCLKIKRKLSK